MIGSIENKKAKKGQEYYRFSLYMDCLGETIESLGWLFFPGAKKWRVMPPKANPMGALRYKGVSLGLRKRLEGLVEAKLARLSDRGPEAAQKAEGAAYTDEELEELEQLGMRGEL